MKYRYRMSKAPVEAVRFQGPNFDEIEAFVGGDAGFRDGWLVVAGPHGPLHVYSGGYIVKENGSFICVRAHDFQHDFEPIP